MKKKEVINIIVKCAKLYEKNLAGKSILFLYLENNVLNYVEIIFQKSNFQHLTGVEINNKKEPKSFYNKCLKRVISEEEISLKKDGTSELKLLVLEQLMNIDKNARMLGNYNNSNLYLYTEKVLGTTSATLGIKRVNKYYIANTALKGDVRNVASNINKIICIMSKAVEQKLYDVVTYKAKDFNLDNIQKNIEIYSKIDMEKIKFKQGLE